MGERLRRIWNHSLFRFGLVGVTNTVLGTAIMFTLYNGLHCTYWQASFANYFLCSILSYFLNKYFTFRSTARSWREAVRFAVNVAVCYLLAYGVSKPLMLRLLSAQTRQVRENAAMLAGMVLFTALNYTGQRFFAFRKSKSK